MQFHEFIINFLYIGIYDGVQDGYKYIYNIAQNETM